MNYFSEAIMTTLSTVVIEPRSEHRYTVIWLHGLGADGHDFEGIVSQLQLTEKSSIRFVFPNAPVQPVTINGGMRMRAWYDIAGSSLEREVDFAGIMQSSAALEALIGQEIAKGIAPERIILAGFSQGGVIALHTGLRYSMRLAGIIALSTYLPTLPQLANEASRANQDLPIFMAHGTADPIVPIEVAKSAYNQLVARHYSIQWWEYAMLHSVCPQEIEHISRFMQQIFKRQG